MGTSSLARSETASTADLVVSDHLKRALQEVIDYCPHRFSLRSVVDFNPHLAESHKGPHPDSTDNDRVGPARVKQIYGRLTAALDMGRILHDCYVANLAVISVHKSENIAVTKMSRTRGIQSARLHGWNCYYFSSHKTRSPLAVALV
jgi:hypothetical protein